MSVFQSRFRETSADRLLRNFGETITYAPAGGSSRSILAIVDRDPPASLDEVPGSIVPRLTITVRDSATSISEDGTGGIAASEVDTGGDKVRLAIRSGGAATDRGIAVVMAQDNGMLVLGVR